MVGGSVAIIPARGGSKRIPRKNLTSFNSRPLIAWTIDAALESRCFDHVVVSTDDAEIADLARQAGAEVLFLRQIAADDQSTSSRATLAALEQCEQHYQHAFSVVAQMLPTCPLRTGAHVARAMAAFVESDADFQISCVAFASVNPWWALKRGEDGRGTALFPAEIAMRSQDLPPIYCPTGAIWLARSTALKSTETFYGKDYRLWEIDRIGGIDIDDVEDLRLAEALLQVASRN